MTQRFIADVMLGRLARWLRLAGFDVEYCRDGDLSDLREKAKRESRIILTRREMGVVEGHLKIEGDRVEEQIRSFFSTGNYRVEKNRFFTRCSACNMLLMAVSRDEVSAMGVPEYILFSIDEFSYCDVCGRVYWSGTHRERFMARFDELGIQIPDGKGR